MFLTRCRPVGVSTQFELAFDLVVDAARQPHAPRFAQALDPGRDVDAVAIDGAALDDHVAEVDADAVADAALLRQRPGLAPAIARWISTAASTASTTLPNSTMAPSPLRSTKRPPCRARSGSITLLAQPLQPGEGAGLVALHEPAVADHVRRHDGRQPALQPRLRHRRPSFGQAGRARHDAAARLSPPAVPSDAWYACRVFRRWRPDRPFIRTAPGLHPSSTAGRFPALDLIRGDGGNQRGTGARLRA